MEEGTVAGGGVDNHACKEHAFDQAGDMEGPNEDVHESTHDKEQEGTYGPWIMVERKKMGKKQQRSGGAHAVVDNGHMRHNKRMKDENIRYVVAPGKVNLIDGLMREARRKHSLPRILSEAQVMSAITTLRKALDKQAHTSDRSPDSAYGPNANKGKEVVSPAKTITFSSTKTSSLSYSGKGKKGTRRARVSKDASSNSNVSSFNTSQTPPTQEQEGLQSVLRPCDQPFRNGKPLKGCDTAT